MTEEINYVLKDLGLSEREVNIYLALLKTGEETASRISEIADMNRVTTYTVLKSLQEKGFCSVFEKNNVQYFKPINPDGITKLLQGKKERVESILPLLKKKQKIIREKPEIMMFEGKKGAFSALEIIAEDAKRKKEVVAYGNFSVANALIEYESLHWRKSRVQNQIKMRAIVNKVIGISEFKTLKNYSKLTKLKALPELEKAKTYTLISENYVGILSIHGEIRVILIKDQSTVEKEKLNFEILWEKAK